MADKRLPPSAAPRVEVLILAAGRGERVGLGDKAFVRLGGVTLLERAVAACAGVAAPLIVAVPPGRASEARAVCPPETSVVEGGPTRAETLRLLLTASRASIVLVHDVVHPLTSPELFRAVLAAVETTGAAIAALRPTDFVYRDGNGRNGSPGVSAERVEGGWIAQSPRAFRRDVLVRGYALLDEMRRHRGATLGSAWQDPGSLEVAQLTGARVVTVPGDIRNLKITSSDDLQQAESFLLGPDGPAAFRTVV